MRPIDADALDIFRVEEDGIHQWREIVNQMVSDIQSLAPVIDVTPVVHGRWIRFEKEWNGKLYYYVRCSECNKERLFDYELRWCNFCGAKMDKEG